ncbi:flagellar biosynthetic protein FliO [Vibrio sp. ZSDZ65]|uniref:Flagellar protein n=1 Tax=Vibrio qingdaonensis TaxID=2829491 RepID=A0A9X3HXT7_9VIBR|nr:flagellar biosynthetic protein FliO [Vibrio qingdaonensis]MCW8347644.1 flagellar biosynthetic protein FliO [Vibrio qingdaonensis]
MKILNSIVVTSLLLSASAQASQAPTQLAGGESPFDLAATLGALVLVVMVILGLAWLLKRMKVPSMINQQGLKIVRQIPVGTKERIAIVEAGDEQFLVGITAQSIQLISKLETPLTQEESTQPAFAAQLSKLMKKQG